MKYTKEELQAMIDCNDNLVRRKQGEILKLNSESDGYRKLMQVCWRKNCLASVATKSELAGNSITEFSE